MDLILSNVRLSDFSPKNSNKVVLVRRIFHRIKYLKTSVLGRTTVVVQNWKPQLLAFSKLQNHETKTSEVITIRNRFFGFGHTKWSICWFVFSFRLDSFFVALFLNFGLLYLFHCIIVSFDLFHTLFFFTFSFFFFTFLFFFPSLSTLFSF